MELKQKIEKFESMRNSLLDDLAAIDEESLSAAPFEGKWSIIEIVEHMMVAEREVMMGLPEIGKVESFKRSLKNKLMYPVVMFVLRNRIKVKVPSRTMKPKGNVRLDEVRRRWDENQEWFRAYLEDCGEEGEKKPVFNHPVAGPINVPQAIDMSIAHFESHSAQIDKLLEELGKSRGVSRV